jgi:FtsH ternary system domain X5
VSRAYRVTVKGSVHRVVHVEDGVCTSLELLPILPAERTAEMLAAELARRGFTRKNGVASRTGEDGVIVEVELATGAVSVKAEATANIAIETQQTERIAEEVLEKGRKQAQQRVEARAESEAKAAETKAREEVTARLEKKLGDLRRELDSVTARVTADALKEKARQLGEIEEMSEDAETGELTIKVRL